MQHNNNILGQPIGFPLANWKPPEVPPREPMEGRFCRVEQLNPRLHAASLHAANAMDVEGRMWTYLPYGPFDTLDSYRGWAEEMCRRSDPLFYAIIDRATDRAVGVASYLRIDPAGGSIEVGHISYSPLLQRTSAATEAMFLMMERAFTLGYRRYEWKCDALNGPSCVTAQRLGFSFEGVFRQATVVKGRNRDTAWFAVIDGDWPALRDAFRRWLHPTNFDEVGKQRVRLSAMITSNPPIPRGHLPIEEHSNDVVRWFAFTPVSDSVRL
jgi:RimJ/RimL family protein N-acetyltransferase